MMSTNGFLKATRSKGDLAGVYESDGDTGYFYLYQLSANEGRRVLDAIQIFHPVTEFLDRRLDIAWNNDESCVALLVDGVIWAAFDRGRKFGGRFHLDRSPTIPTSVLNKFVM